MTNGKVGIGTTSPTHQLHVAGTGSTRIIIENAAKKQNPKAIVTVAKEEPILNWEEWMPVESEIEDDYIVYKVLCDYCDEKYPDGFINKDKIWRTLANSI